MPKAKILKMTRSEREVLAQVIEAAAALGVELDRRNTGMAMNPKGRPVRFGTPGDSDTTGTIPLGPNAGRRLDVETKEESFDPSKLSGKKREHFDRQLDRLRRTNAQGGIGMWVRDSGDFLHAMQRVLEGWKVEIDDVGFCWLVSPDEPMAN